MINVAHQKSSKPAHTPGPWRAAIGDRWRPEPHENVEEIACVPHFTNDAIDIYGPLEYPTAEQHIANAHLIAAAPDLLANLKDAYEELQLQGVSPDCAAMKAIAAAIAKAEGR